MLPPDKNEILKEMDRVRAETEAALQALDPDTLIYEEGEWTIKDIIGHLTTWEEEAIAAMQAYLKNSTYVMDLKKSSEDEFNARQVARRKNFSNERIWADWRDNRAWFRDLVNQLDIGKIKGQMTAPWGSHTTFIAFMEDMLKHEMDHRYDILRKVGHG